jgi:hypothetical protein
MLARGEGGGGGEKVRKNKCNHKNAIWTTFFTKATGKRALFVSFQVPYISCIMYKRSSTSTGVLVVSSTKVPSIFETIFSADILYNHILYQTNYVIRINWSQANKGKFCIESYLVCCPSCFFFSLSSWSILFLFCNSVIVRIYWKHTFMIHQKVTVDWQSRSCKLWPSCF